MSTNHLQEVQSAELGRLPRQSGGSVSPHRSFVDVLNAADKEAQRMKDQYVSTEHILLALTDVPSEAKELLKEQTKTSVKRTKYDSNKNEIRNLY